MESTKMRKIMVHCHFVIVLNLRKDHQKRFYLIFFFLKRFQFHNIKFWNKALLECWANHIFICLWKVAEEQGSKKANPSKFQLEEQIIAVPRNGNKKCGELRVIIHVKPVSVSQSPESHPTQKCLKNEICFDSSTSIPLPLALFKLCFPQSYTIQ